jgi:type 1 glutamine amidotransferase
VVAVLLVLCSTATALAEKAPISMVEMHRADLCLIGVVTARTESTSGIPLVGERTTAIALTVLVEQVQFDRMASGAKPGAPITIGAWTRTMSVLGGTGASGHFIVPAVGQRVRVFASTQTGSNGASGQTIEAEFPNGFQPLLNASIVSGDDEYRSEITMPLLADAVRAAVTAATHAAPATPKAASAASGSRQAATPFDPKIAHWDVPKRVPDPSCPTAFADCALGSSDCLALFFRWREADARGLDTLESALRSGLPIVGFRTSTHAFAMPDASKRTWWNNDFPKQVFGQQWISHHGHTSTTRILPPDGAAKGQPILRGVKGGQVVPSWLYLVEPLPADATVLLWGEAIGSEQPESAPRRQPILWVREHAGPTTEEAHRARYAALRAAVDAAGRDGARPCAPDQLMPRRMAFTTLGHPGDFADPEMRRIAVQMVLWAGGLESAIPAAGLTPEWPADWTPPPTR